MSDGLITMTAVEVLGLLRAGEVSSHDLLDALEHRIGAVDGAVGAFYPLSVSTALESTLTGSQPYPWRTGASCAGCRSRSPYVDAPALHGYR